MFVNRTSKLFLGQYWTLIIVLWAVASWAFCINFKAVWIRLQGYLGKAIRTQQFFPNFPLLTCNKAPNSPKTTPIVRCTENPFSPSVYTALFISCLQKGQIFLLLVAPRHSRWAPSRKGSQTQYIPLQLWVKWKRDKRQSNVQYRWVNSPS